MGLFDNAEEQARKAKLKDLEDKRVAFAQKLAQQGFAPERMLFAQNENGGFTSLCRFNDRYWLIVSPGFGTDEDFVIEPYDVLNYRVQEVHVKAEGMGGLFGFGKKAQVGLEYIVTRHDGSEATLPFVCGRSCWMECVKASKNPLLRIQRRRSDANIVWDLHPLDRTGLERVLETVGSYFPKQ